jgi:branched-chain amino acid transport system ATP-binding protein
MLKVESASAGYGRMTVLRDIDLEFPAGSVTLILGPNGAGKTTLLRMMSRMIRLQSGWLTLDGASLASASTEDASRKGIRHVLEGHRVFPGLSVEDNIRLGQIGLPRERRLSTDEVCDRAYEVFPILGDKRRDLARSLSGGQQQMLTLAQAWSSQPRFLLCDEPSLGVAQSLLPVILEFLKRRAAEGMGVILVEQLIDQPLAVADSLVVIKQGRIVAQGSREEMPQRDELVEMMLG